MLLLFFLLLCCSAFFSGSETSLFSLSNIDIHNLKKTKSSSVAKVIKHLREPRKLLITILLGNELANVSMSIVGAAAINQVFHAGVEGQTLAAIIILTPVILVFGEIVPKNISIRYAATLAPIVIWPLDLFYQLARPLRRILTKLADWVIFFFGGSHVKSEPMIMEDEFRKLIDLGHKEGVIVEEEREMIHNVFEFTDKVVSDIMTPEQKIFALSIDTPYEKILDEVKHVQFSRIPIYKDNLDNIIGILHIQDLFSFHRRLVNQQKPDVSTLLRSPLFVDKNTPLEHLLKEFQRSQLHMALIKNENGILGGLVTMADVLDELFGEME